MAKRYPAQTQLKDIEQGLTGLFARVVAESKFEGIFATHPAVARMTGEAKHSGLLSQTMPVVSVACDHLADATSLPLVNEVYQYKLRDANKADHNNYVLVASEKTAQKFISGGYPPEVVKVVNCRYELNPYEKEVVEKKQRDLERISQSGELSDESPPILSLIQDNFETVPERLIAENLIKSYALELADRRLMFTFLMTEADENRVRKQIKDKSIPDHCFEIIETVENLEEFLTHPQNHRGSIFFVRKYPDWKGIVDLDKHVQFTDMQMLLELYSHVVFSRPSEVPRDAANFGTPSFLVFPYGPVEVSIGEQAIKDGFSLPWATVDRCRSSEFHRRMKGLPRLDLADPHTYRKLLEMSRTALQSPMRQPLTGIVESIVEIIQAQEQKLSRE